MKTTVEQFDSFYPAEMLAVKNAPLFLNRRAGLFFCHNSPKVICF
jgi:hypothetical protein